VVVVAAGAYVWSGQAADARLARAWPDVSGKDLPVPFPLSEAEVEALLAEAAVPTDAGESAPEDASAEDEEGDESVAPAPVDVDAVAMERAVARGAHLFNVRLACAECHGTDLRGPHDSDSVKGQGSDLARRRPR
jgi:mono/diheme cytochrome c family protein